VKHASLLPMTLEGFVFGGDGRAAVGAVVVTSAGGEASTDSRGYYRLDVHAPLAADRLLLTARRQLPGALGLPDATAPSARWASLSALAGR
jgi:hypothetical protein